MASKKLIVNKYDMPALNGVKKVSRMACLLTGLDVLGQNTGAQHNGWGLHGRGCNKQHRWRDQRARFRVCARQHTRFSSHLVHEKICCFICFFSRT